MLAHDPSECLWQDKDEVEVGHGEQFAAALFQPIFRVLAVTLGTVAIATGMIGVLPVAAAITLVAVTAELGSATGDQGLDGTLMPPWDGGSMGIQIRLAIAAQNVGDLQHGTRHRSKDDRSVR